MRKFVTLAAVLAAFLCVSACTSWPGRPLSCMERVAIAYNAIEEAAKQSKNFLDADIIDVGQAKGVSSTLKLADAAVDQAAPLCAIDEAMAYDYLAQFNAFLMEASTLMKGE